MKNITGIAVPKWSSLTLSSDLYGIDISYHTGLWKECTCLTVGGSESCSCAAKHKIPGWLVTVRALETIGLICLLLSGFVSLVKLFSLQDKPVRANNCILVACSGTLILIGVTVFGSENAEDFDELFDFIDTLPIGFDKHGTLSVAFILSTIAGVLSLVVCLPLLIIDYFNQKQAFAGQKNPAPVQYTNQGRVILPPPGRTILVGSRSAQQQTGYVQSHFTKGKPVRSSSVYPQPSQYWKQEHGVQHTP